MQNAKRVAVIGAGVAGLATAKVFHSQGYAVTVFEQGETLGGVWSPARHYPGLRLQTTRQCYAFSDFPMPAHYPEFPTGQQIYDYLVAYARHFEIYDRIRPKCRVIGIGARDDGKPGWRVRVGRREAGEDTADDFDFVVICNGVFSLANTPEFPGLAQFRANGGVVLHSSQLNDTAPLVGRTVAVVGFGKSALDIAEAAAVHGRSSAIIGRRVPWKVPHRIWGRINIKHFILSRFTEIWFPYPEMSRGRRFLHRWLRPLVNAHWWLSERVIGGQLGFSSPQLRPDVPLRQAGGCVTLAIDNLAAICAGRIRLHRGSVRHFTSAGIELDNGENVPAETVVLATGFRQELPFLGEREKSLLRDQAGAIQLYRFLINPDIPAMGFNGYNGVGICQLSAEVGAAWLVSMMEGRIALPSREAMHASIREEIRVRRELLSPAHDVGYYVTPFTIGYLDDLLRDLGLPPADRHRGLFAWLFEPVDPTEYRGILEQTRGAEKRPVAN